MRCLSVLVLLGATLVGCVGPGFGTSEPAVDKFPRQQVIIILDAKIGAYSCFIDHVKQSLYLCDEVTKK